LGLVRHRQRDRRLPKPVRQIRQIVEHAPRHVVGLTRELRRCGLGLDLNRRGGNQHSRHLDLFMALRNSGWTRTWFRPREEKGLLSLQSMAASTAVGHEEGNASANSGCGIMVFQGLPPERTTITCPHFKLWDLDSHGSFAC
jgi:hypothetical protein